MKTLINSLILVTMLIWMVYLGYCLLQDDKPRVEKKPTNVITGLTIVTVTMDGCEYIQTPSYGIACFTYAHKGNCTNSIHIYR